MNNVSLIGRLTKDPDIRYTDGGNTICRFTIAIDRRVKSEGKETADFIPCIAFGRTAEFVEKYFRKGNRMGAIGRIQTGSYANKEGIKVYTTDVIVETVEFVEGKSSAGADNRTQRPEPNSAICNGFMNIPDEAEDGGLPFN